MPNIVLLPSSEDQVAECVKIVRKHGFKITPRGAGTGLSGGAIPEDNAVTICVSRLNKILKIDIENGFAIVQAGVVNKRISEFAQQYGLFYPPDPSSQVACTIGGNVGENAGGPHCLALGVTTNHIMGLQVVLDDGSITWLGGTTRETPTLDLRSVFIGSEGMLGIVTQVVVRLLKTPQSVQTVCASFKTIQLACETVSQIISKGIVPSSLEIMDRVTIDACEPVYKQNYPKDAGAILIVEVDGEKESVEEYMNRIIDICKEAGTFEIRKAQNEQERADIWAARKGAIGALGVLAPSYYLVDGVVPRTVLPQVIEMVTDIGVELGLRIGNVFHAGDGNLHPCILFDERDKQQTQLAIECGRRILEICVQHGGALSGEHGIGTEKRPYMHMVFSKEDMQSMQNIITAFDSDNVFNPGKVFDNDYTTRRY